MLLLRGGGGVPDRGFTTVGKRALTAAGSFRLDPEPAEGDCGLDCQKLYPSLSISTKAESVCPSTTESRRLFPSDSSFLLFNSMYPLESPTPQGGLAFLDRQNHRNKQPDRRTSAPPAATAMTTSNDKNEAMDEGDEADESGVAAEGAAEGADRTGLVCTAPTDRKGDTEAKVRLTAPSRTA